MLCRLHLTGVMAVKTLHDMFARPDITATGSLTPQNVTVKHRSQKDVGATGFEPATCREATALQVFLKFVPATSGFIIKLSPHRFAASYKTFAVN